MHLAVPAIQMQRSYNKTTMNFKYSQGSQNDGGMGHTVDGAGAAVSRSPLKRPLYNSDRTLLNV